MNEWDSFDRQLADSMTDLPPSDATLRAVTPWTQAVGRIVLGLCLSCFTLQFLFLQYLLPAVGAVHLYLGFRSLRKNNRWFRLCWIVSGCHAVLLSCGYLLAATPFSGSWSLFRTVLSVLLRGLLFLFFRQALRRAAADLGQAPRGDPMLWALVWYGVMTAFALFWPTPGFLPFLAMAAAFVCIIRSLLRVSEQLNSWGYTVRTAPVKISSGHLKRLYYGSLAALILVFSLLSSHVFVNGTPIEQTSDTVETAGIRHRLLEMGFPEETLALLPPEEVAELESAAACLSLPNQPAGMPDPEEGDPPLTASGVMVYLGNGAARLYVQADYGGGSAWRQMLAAFANVNTVRWNGACYLRYEKDGVTYRAEIPVEEQVETENNFFTGPMDVNQIRARYSFPPGATDRTCLVACSVDLWQVPREGAPDFYYLDVIVDFFRPAGLSYPFAPLTGRESSLQRTQYYNYFEFQP